MSGATTISRLMVSLSALVFSTAALIFVLRFGVSDVMAVATARNGLKITDTVYTQSEDGKTLYQWLWDKKAKQWKKETYSGSF